MFNYYTTVKCVLIKLVMFIEGTKELGCVFCELSNVCGLALTVTSN